ncbi:ATP F0F1 synthase subunit beta, partial [Synechocystis salina LEGE 06155]|nr:ATP F0F1 synthase subunit beta [Synechocystis salina LEGE 06155]
MLPDPWIVVAEIINFLVLVALLQRFLYQPITQAMQQREQSIADRLQSATLREAEAQTTITQYEQLQTDWAATTKARLHAMRQQLEAEQNDRREQMRAELTNQRKQWYEALHQEQQACLANLREQVQTQIIQTVRQTLNDLANTTLEQQM